MNEFLKRNVLAVLLLTSAATSVIAAPITIDLSSGNPTRTKSSAQDADGLITVMYTAAATLDGVASNAIIVTPGQNIAVKSWETGDDGNQFDIGLNADEEMLIEYINFTFNQNVSLSGIGGATFDVSLNGAAPVSSSTLTDNPLSVTTTDIVTINVTWDEDEVDSKRVRNITVEPTAVPEPATLLLTILTGAGILMYRKR